MSDLRDEILRAFSTVHGMSAAWVARGPGRVNLIGEHTDYNDGFVLPMALERAVWIALEPTADRHVTVHFLDYGTTETFALDNLQREGTSPVEYIKGVAAMLTAEGHTLSGWRGVLKGDVPIGAGLSSSAALEMAAARAFCAVSDIAWDTRRMALLGQRVENEWLGLKTGIMDQMISASGESGHAVMIDCRSLALTPAPLPDGTAVVVMDTGTRRGLVHSAYNQRREHCEAAARHFGVAALRDLSVEQFTARQDELDDETRRRARHVVTENARVLAAFDALHAHDARIFGALMDASHASLRDDFEVSTEALDTMVSLAQRHPAAYGARMTGAGFGGCAVALVRADMAQEFTAWVTQQYAAALGKTAALYICTASDGASITRI